MTNHPRRGPVKTSRSHDQPLISACMIVRDEQLALPDCFESLHQAVDEVVVYDTGSTDGTVDLCRRAGARVFEGYWDDDFARARNTALEQCRGQWVLWIDADERFRCPNIMQLRAGLRDMSIGLQAVTVEIHNLGDDPMSTAANNHRALRIFRRAECQWYGSIHEQVDFRADPGRQLAVVPLNGAHIEHIGYRNEVVESRNKLERNLRLAEAAVHKPVIRGQEGSAEMNLGRALAALGRFDEAQEWMDKAIDIAPEGITKRASLMFSAQNLMGLGRFEECARVARLLGERCQQKGIALYLEGTSLRRLGRTADAIEVLNSVTSVSNEDGFTFPDGMLEAELSGAYLDLGMTAEAADHLAKLFESAPQVGNIQALLKIFAATGRSLDQVLSSMPRDRLERVAAALLVVEPVIADPAAELLYQRFGPAAPVLAAAIKFGPMTSTDRALEWSHRLRSIGMSAPCPLISQAQIEVLDVPTRARAAATAYAAFKDSRGAELLLALAPGVHEDDITRCLQEVSMLAPELLAGFASALAGEGARDAGEVGDSASRRRTTSMALATMGLPDLAHEAHETAETCSTSGAGAQLAALGADR